jgi:hypothetical protein
MSVTTRLLPALPLALTALTTACLALPAAAVGISFEGGGSFTEVPLYRAYVFTGLDRDNDGGYLFDDIDGIDYVSNIAPKPMATANVQVQADGASFDASGWSAWSGFYASRSYATMTVENANENHRYYAVAGQGSSTQVQFFTPEAAASRAVFTFKVTGTESNPVNAGLVTGRLDFAATTEAGRNWLDLFNGGFGANQLFEYGTGTFSYSLPVADLGTPIYLHYWSSAFAEFLGGQVPGGSSFTATADYGHTVVLDEVQLLDADDNAISEWTLEDMNMGEVVFDQNGRVGDILPPPPIPEPGSWALMAAGLLAVGHRARARRRS